MNRSNKKNKIIIIVLLIALFVRAIFFIASWHNKGFSEDSIPGNDPSEYHSLALSLIKEGKFSIDGELNTKRTPVYPLFVGTIYSLFGQRLWLVYLAQILLDAITCLLIYLLTILIFNNKKIALAAGLLYAVDTLPAIYSMELFSDILFVFVFVLSLLVLFFALNKRVLFLFVLAGIILGLAILIRPIAQYFFIIAVIAIIGLPRIFFRKKGQEQEKRKKAWGLKAAAIFLIGLELILLPWQLRNFINFQSFNISSIDGYNLFYCNAVFTEANINKISRKEAEKRLEKFLPIEFASLNNMEKSKAYRKVALNYIKEHPKDYLIIHFKGILKTFTNSTKYQLMEIFGQKRKTEGVENKIPLSENIIDRIKRVLANAKEEYYLSPILSLILLFEYILAFIGLVSLFIKKHWASALIFIGIIAYFILLTGPAGEERYRIPIVPFYLMLSAYGIFAIRELLRRKSKYENSINN